MADDEVVLRVQVGDQVVTARFSVDRGLTAEKQRSMEALRAHAAIPAVRIGANRKGVSLVWRDGWRYAFVPSAWSQWWGGRRSVQGHRALEYYQEFEAYLYGEILGPKLEHDLAEGKTTLYAILRDFPKVIEHYRPIQVRVGALYEHGLEIRRGPGERTPADRQATLDRWMTTVSRVEEFQLQGQSLADAFQLVAKLEGRAGKAAADAVRGEYERGMRWRRLFRPG